MAERKKKGAKIVEAYEAAEAVPIGCVMNDGAESIGVAVRNAEVHGPVIQIGGGRLPENATAGERAIIAAGMPVYRRGAMLVRPVVEEVDAAHGHRTHVAQLARLDLPYLRDLLCRAAQWERFNARKQDWVAVNAPQDVAQTILCRFGEWTFPPVVGVLTTPTLRPDGTILAEPGYDAETRLILMAPPPMPRVALEPTRDDAERALGLLDGLLDEFPFIDDASRSVALSGLITPIVRGAFPVAPMHVARAPTPASGKSYLWDVMAAIALGQPCPVMAAGRSEEETEKRLGAALLAGQPIISIDNVNGELGGDALCQAIERPVVEVRILGKSERVRIEARGTTLFATGNNLVLLGDMTRRVLLATLDPMLERPELRQFTGNPVTDVLANRGKYIGAALTLVRAYIAAGRPDPAPRLASFEGWSDSVRSALIWLGRADPVITMEQARDEDPQLAALHEMLTAWADALGTGPATRRTAADLLTLIEERETRLAGDGDAHEGYEREWRYPTLRNVVLAAAASRGRPEVRTLGRWLVRHRSRIAGGLRFAGESDKHGHGWKWWVDKC